MLVKENYHLAEKELPQIIPSVTLTRTVGTEKRAGSVSKCGLEAFWATPHRSNRDRLENKPNQVTTMPKALH